MEKERSNLVWRPTRTAPSMSRDIQRSTTVSTNSMDTNATTGEMNTVAPSEEDHDTVNTWREVLVPSYTVLLSGAESVFMDFIFIPEWLPLSYIGSKNTTKDAQSRFDDFVISLFNKIAASETEKTGQRYVRRVDFHKLEEEEELSLIHI